MNRKSKLRAMPEEKPEQLSYDEIRRLADDLAFDLMGLGDEVSIRIMLLMQEIASHPSDMSHIETVANLTLTYLFAHTRQADIAYRELMTAERAKLQKGGGVR